MSHILLFGASSGLGEVICSQLQEAGHIVSVASRNCKAYSGSSHKVDLLQLTSEKISEIFKDNDIPDAICFAQRYRPACKLYCPINEYQLCVVAIAQILNYLLDSQNLSSISGLKVVIVGSTYSSQVGHDQNWSYHAVKHAQSALVKYYSLNSNGLINAYLVSPPTFVKPGAFNYWSSTEKFQKWLNYPPGSMILAESVSDFIVYLLTQGSPLLSGSDLRLDHGLSFLYHDQ